jgi:hypothetical protein
VGSPISGAAGERGVALAVVVRRVGEESPAVLLKVGPDVAVAPVSVGLGLGSKLVDAGAGVARVTGRGVTPDGVDLRGQAGRPAWAVQQPASQGGVGERKHGPVLG